MIKCGILLFACAYFVQSASSLSGCACTREFNPMCGSDGVTYSNRCQFECANSKAGRRLHATPGRCGPTARSKRQAEVNDIPCSCPKIYQPVCGTDGKTYSNECILNCAKSKNSNLEVRNQGPCQKDASGEACACTFIYQPVCGTDGKTYGNQCALDCASKKTPGLRFKHQGECQRDDSGETCFCPLNYQPVCGTDGKTYGNQCALNCASKKIPGLRFKHQGECQGEGSEGTCFCPLNYQPVCGTDGKTYGNQCALNCASKKNSNLRLKYQGECQKENPQPGSCICPAIYKPVCGNDGKTYSNECNLNCAKSTNPGLAVKHEGECPPPICVCPYIYKPVCGNDGKTYPNKCVLDCAKSVNQGLEVKYRGECQKEDPQPPTCVCAEIYDPVCGNDGKTYGNKCELDCAKSVNQGLEVKHRGQCRKENLQAPPCFCPYIYEPVCGTDGKTYPSKCNLNCARSMNSNLAVKHLGPCQQTALKSCACPRNYSPICGSDGVTYSNECTFNCARSQKPDLRFSYAGQCGENVRVGKRDA